MAFQGGLGDFTCRDSVCNDPLKSPATGAPLNPDIEAVPAMPAMPAKPPMPAMGCTPATPAMPPTEATEGEPAVPGVSIRIVVSKLLDASKITSDGTHLLPGVADLIDESTGQAIPLDELNGIWDPGGTPDFTSDPILSPFGPAIQLSPLGLIHSNEYTVVIHPGLIQDRHGNPLADQNGNLLTADLKLKFTSENVAANITVGSFHTINPYQLPGDFTPQYGLAPVIYAKFRITGPNGSMTTVEKYYESVPDLATGTCPEADSTTMQINLANTTGTPGESANWPIGTYKLFFAVNSTDENTSTFRSSEWPGAGSDGILTFEVVEPPPGTGPDTDASIIDLHPLPEHCPCL
jgi:hypothetical protein